MEEKEKWEVSKKNLHVYRIFVSELKDGTPISKDYEDGYWHPIGESEKIFDSKTEAEAYVKEQLDKVMSMSDAIYGVLGYIEDCMEKGEERDEKMQALLPYPYRRSFYKYYDDDDVDLSDKVSTALRGILSMDGVNVRVCDVKYVKWGHEAAELSLSNGGSIRTRTIEDYRIVEAIFGCNNSDLVFNTMVSNV